ncbi:hypothetical protein B0I37DRAFT_152385 [Chaetomium sp. MPI-CAGE-AT-0009]|nr:hypothetical protein B0I37DRAFT_152385 [Chaetomium sp. MPI-CAGE-AT-0009]
MRREQYRNLSFGSYHLTTSRCIAVGLWERSGRLTGRPFVTASVGQYVLVQLGSDQLCSSLTSPRVEGNQFVRNIRQWGCLYILKRFTYRLPRLLRSTWPSSGAIWMFLPRGLPITSPTVPTRPFGALHDLSPVDCLERSSSVYTLSLISRAIHRHVSMLPAGSRPRFCLPRVWSHKLIPNGSLAETVHRTATCTTHGGPSQLSAGSKGAPRLLEP